MSPHTASRTTTARSVIARECRTSPGRRKRASVPSTRGVRMTASRLLVPLLVTAAFVATVTAQDTPRAPVTRICVVDIGLLFRDYKRKDKLEAEVNVMRERIKADLEDRAETLRRRRKGLEMLKDRPELMEDAIA